MIADIKSVRLLQDICYDRSLSFHRNKLSPTLCELCSLKLVEDAYFMKRLLPFIPRQLHLLLMKIALRKGRFPSVEVLLEEWPEEVFSLSVLFEEFSIIGIEYLEPVESRKYLHFWWSCILTICKVFVKLIENKSSSKLKILDLGAIPAGDNIVDTIINLLLNLFKTKEKLENNDSFLQKKKKLKYSLEHPLPFGSNFSYHCRNDNSHPDQQPYSVESYTLKISCAVFEKETIEKLRLALSLSYRSTSPLKIIIEKLDITSCGLNIVKQLINFIPAENLYGLSLPYNAFFGKNLTKLVPEIIKFINITSLNLSNNNINFVMDFHALSAMKQILVTLVNLCRLDLGNNRLSGCMKTLYCDDDDLMPNSYSKIDQNTSSNEGNMHNLEGVPNQYFITSTKGLQYLNLLGCHIISRDLYYLAVSSYTSTLRDLDLSENNLAPQIESLVELLKAVSHHLCVLELENCHFSSLELEILLKCFSEIKQLWYLNVARNKFPSSHLCKLLVMLCSLPELKYTRVSYAMDCYNEDEDKQISLQNQLKETVEKLFISNTSTDSSPITVFWSK